MEKVVQLLRIKRFLKLRKRSFIFLPLVFSLFVLQVSGQDILDKKINLNQQDASIKDALLDVQKQSGVKIIYGESINGYPEVKITAKTDNITVREAIELILKKTNLQYEVTGTHVMIIERKTPKPTTNPNGAAGQGQQGSGTLKGRIVEFETSQPLPGASVNIVGTSIGGQSNESGYYTLTGVPVGNRTLEVSFIGYQTERISVNVNAGRETTYDVRLQGDDNSLEEIVVSTPRSTFTSERQLIDEIKQSRTIISGISNEHISRLADRNMADVAKRITGVTVVDDRFIVVRGMAQRYNITYLNNNIAPSTEPYSRAFAFDLLPTHIVDKVIVNKSPVANLQGDYSGGAVQVFTKQTANAKGLNIGIQTTARSNSTFGNGMMYRQGGLDWLGFDDGSRRLPQNNLVKKSEGAQSIEQENIGSFSDNWTYGPRKVTPDIQAFVNYFDNWQLGSWQLFNLSSLVYTNENRFVKRNVQVGNTWSYQIGPMPVAVEQNNTQGVEQISGQTAKISAMQNFALRIHDGLRLNWNNFFLNEGRGSTVLYFANPNIHPELRNSDVRRDQKRTSLIFEQRLLYNGNLGGSWEFDKNKEQRHLIEWNMGYTYAKQYSPDLRIANYQRQKNEDNSDNAWEVNFGSDASLYFGMLSRLFISNDEQIYNISGDYAFHAGKNFVFKLGTFHRYSLQNVDRRFFKVLPGFMTGNEVTIGGWGYEEFARNMAKISPQLLRFGEQDLAWLWDKRYFPEDGTGLKLYDVSSPVDRYKASEQNNAAYLLGEWNYEEKLIVNAGLRFEYNLKKVGGSGNRGTLYFPIPVRLETRNWLPSGAVNYWFTPNIAVKASLGKSINRPEYREISPFSDFNFIDNEQISGNVTLKEAKITNYDVRVEYYPEQHPNEMISAGLFFKRLKNPIERLRFESAGSVNAAASIFPSISFFNPDKARVYGLEIDIKKSLEFIPLSFSRNLSAVLNGAWIRSSVSNTLIERTEEQRRQYGASSGSELGTFSGRPLQGQPPYVINAGLFYENPGKGTKVGLIYNRSGDNIYAIGNGNRDTIQYLKDRLLSGEQLSNTELVKLSRRPGLMELARQSLDITWTQRIVKSMQLRVTAQNITNTAVRIVEDQNWNYRYEPEIEKKANNNRSYYEGDNIFRSFKPGVTFNLSVTYSF